MASLTKADIYRSRAVAFRPGLLAATTRCESTTVPDMNEFRRQMDTTKSESTVRFDQLIKAMMEQNANISSQILKNSAETTTRMDKMSAETSNRMDKMLALVVTIFIAGTGYLDFHLKEEIKNVNRKIETGNAQLKKEMETGNAQLKKEMETGNAQLKNEMKEMDRKIEAGNAQLKEDLMKLLQGHS